MAIDISFVQTYNSLRASRQKLARNMVGLAQLVRALVCGTRGHGFDSHIPPHFFLGRLNPFNVIEHPDAMGCSQVVRHGTLTPALVGSNPATPAIIRFTSSVGRAPDF